MTQVSVPTPTNFFSSLDWIVIKKYASKIISVGLLVSGLRGIATAVLETFKYTQAVQAGVTLDQAGFQTLLRIFLSQGIGALVETSYGLILLFKPTRAVKLIHLVIGSLLFILPYLIPNTLLQQLEQFLPQANSASPQVLAQETPPQQALSDYQFQLQQYRDAHKEYLSAKNAFLSFGTLNSRAQAIDSTKTLLIHRSETLRTYLFALRILLRQTPAVPETTLASLVSKLEQTETNLIDHQHKIPPLTDLGQITTAAQEFETVYPHIQVLAYQSLYALILGNLNSNSLMLAQTRLNLQNLTSQATAEELELSQINQWLKDTQSSLDQNQATISEAEKLLSHLRPTQSLLITNQRDFSKILNLLNLTRNRLITITSFLKETIQAIKYG